jgi:ubiquitin-conjugating enzyme E2 S
VPDPVARAAPRRAAVGTPYQGGVFVMKLVLGQDFPASPPRGFFLTKIYHPNVAPNGDICVNTLKKDWSAKVTLSHVLQVGRPARSSVAARASQAA